MLAGSAWSAARSSATKQSAPINTPARRCPLCLSTCSQLHVVLSPSFSQGKMQQGFSLKRRHSPFNLPCENGEAGGARTAKCDTEKLLHSVPVCWFKPPSNSRAGRGRRTPRTTFPLSSPHVVPPGEPVVLSTGEHQQGKGKDEGAKGQPC